MKKFFSKIVNWIKETPSIQPLLIIAAIFVLIFSLTLIPQLVNWISGLFSQPVLPTTLNFEDAEDKLANPGEENFLFLYSDTTCSFCTHLKENTMSLYLKRSGSMKAYSVEVDKAVEDDYINDKFDNRVTTMLERFLEPGLDYTDYYKLDYGTPILAYYKEGKLFRVHQGDFASYNNFTQFVNPDVSFTLEATSTPTPETEAAFIPNKFYY